ncbi:MAG TPA: sugar phosphate isomerase/epimerase family protein [Sedimentibacter sp.]|jgi:sugar phosphate isomerase/epimerase|nr:sugar phosphate isomerase/epimerase [Sedimentibacter sp.]HOW23747.1 sugar phosphate isomerase/epimerase family protein [Sedimentibacter sp.]HRC79864.1 sugar phosphate isomerase/epimerase family protein [Sedimentibacter sp.]
MRIGVCTNFLKKETYALHLEDFEELTSVFDFVELPAMTISQIPEEIFEKLKDELQINKLNCDYVTNIFPKDLSVIGHDSDTKKIENYLDGLIPRLEKIGCKGIVFGSGYARRLPDGASSSFGDYCMQKLIVDVLLPKLEKSRMKVLIEPLHPELCNYLNTIEHAAKICKMCDSPYVGIVADSYNLMYYKKTPEEIAKYASYIWHVHLSESDRRAPGNNPSEDLKRFILALRKAKYKGSISLECQMSDYREYRKNKEMCERLLKD